MKPPMTPQDQERLQVEIESLRVWYAELDDEVKLCLDDSDVTREDFATLVVQVSRVLLRLKNMIGQSGTRVKSPG